MMNGPTEKQINSENMPGIVYCIQSTLVSCLRLPPFPPADPTRPTCVASFPKRLLRGILASTVARAYCFARPSSPSAKPRTFLFLTTDTSDTRYAMYAVYAMRSRRAGYIGGGALRGGLFPRRCDFSPGGKTRPGR